MHRRHGPGRAHPVPVHELLRREGRGRRIGTGGRLAGGLVLLAGSAATTVAVFLGRPAEEPPAPPAPEPPRSPGSPFAAPAAPPPAGDRTAPRSGAPAPGAAAPGTAEPRSGAPTGRIALVGSATRTAPTALAPPSGPVGPPPGPPPPPPEVPRQRGPGPLSVDPGPPARPAPCAAPAEPLLAVGVAVGAGVDVGVRAAVGVEPPAARIDLLPRQRGAADGACAG